MEEQSKENQSIEELIYNETKNRLAVMEKPDYEFPESITKVDVIAIATWCYTQGAYVAQFLSFKQLLINIFCFNIV